jgi:hypothetical protein
MFLLSVSPDGQTGGILELLLLLPGKHYTTSPARKATKNKYSTIYIINHICHISICHYTRELNWKLVLSWSRMQTWWSKTHTGEWWPIEQWNALKCGDKLKAVSTCFWHFLKQKQLYICVCMYIYIHIHIHTYIQRDVFCIILAVNSDDLPQPL